jgi:hypothetical protein
MVSWTGLAMERMGNPEGPISVSDTDHEFFTGMRGTTSKNALLLAQERPKQHLLPAGTHQHVRSTFFGFKHSRCFIIHDINATTSQSSCINPIVGKFNGQFKKRGNLCQPTGVYPDVSQMVCWIVWRSSPIHTD